MYQTIFGIAMIAVTALALWWKARHHYRCPICGQFVQWKDITCPHCGNDMEYRHREVRDPGASMMSWSKSRSELPEPGRRSRRHRE
jgi:predicted RNA-binding Zn-ribbon protein involved in translation (DUF1610 family)